MRKSFSSDARRPACDFQAELELIHHNGLLGGGFVVDALQHRAHDIEGVDGILDELQMFGQFRPGVPNMRRYSRGMALRAVEILPAQ